MWQIPIDDFEKPYQIVICEYYPRNIIRYEKPDRLCYSKLDTLFCNNTDRGGRPNIDVIVMLRRLFIQQLYSLSDEQLERKLVDRISFRMFLGTTEVVPDSTTLWKFRVRLADKGYFGANTKGYDAAMRKAAGGHPRSYEDGMRNNRISSKRSPVERYFAFTKKICKAGHVAVITIDVYK